MRIWNRPARNMKFLPIYLASSAFFNLLYTILHRWALPPCRIPCENTIIFRLQVAPSWEVQLPPEGFDNSTLNTVYYLQYRYTAGESWGFQQHLPDLDILLELKSVEILWYLSSLLKLFSPKNQIKFNKFNFVYGTLHSLSKFVPHTISFSELHKLFILLIHILNKILNQSD